MIEADFAREYGIDLDTDLDRLTWRRFMCLIGGLSFESRFLRDYARDGKTGMITDPRAAERAFKAWAR